MVCSSFNRGFHLSVFYGLDMAGSQTILFATVSRETSYKHTLSILEKYEEAGFHAPEHVLANSQEVLDAFSQKFGKAVTLELCKYSLLKSVKDELKEKQSLKHARTLVRKCNRILVSHEPDRQRVARLIGGERKKEISFFAAQFNEFYIGLTSEQKVVMQRLYKQRCYYEACRSNFNPRHSILGRQVDGKSKGKWICTKLADSVYTDYLAQIVKRTLTRNGRFEDLVCFVARYSEV